MTEPLPSSSHVAAEPLLPLSVAALGVVYGDIGTSPLYALRECFLGTHSVPPTTANVLGVLSLIVWSLVLVISVKYLVFILQADNRGEGGTLALMALLSPRPPAGRAARWLLALGLFGTALLYGDGILTPAISVLSAAEGLEVAAPVLSPFVLPVTVAILVLLFVVQHHGSARIGAIFGPVMVVWFTTLALLGVRGILYEPAVLGAVDPRYGLRFFLDTGWTGFLVLGAVFLVVTGGEALYADMGHFGRRAIRVAWFGLVLPALVLNYFGQGALLLTNPAETTQPFYHLAPPWALYPLVGLATLATIIASQALITGVFSLTRQAVQLSYCPRLTIAHTSPTVIGQIYIPSVNWLLLFGTVTLVLTFGSSSALASAYGVAVATTMAITTLLACAVAHARGWGGRYGPLLALLVFLPLDLAFFGANVGKIDEGGWVPLLLGSLIFLVMATWQRGTEMLTQRLRENTVPLEEFVPTIAAHPPARVPGTAVFMTTSFQETPRMLLHHLKHNQVLHEQAVLFTVVIDAVPRVQGEDRLEVQDLGAGVYRVIVHYGFMQTPRVPAALVACRRFGLTVDPDWATFYVGHHSLLPRPGKGQLQLWRKRLFAFLARNALRATAFYRLPPSQVVEIGVQVEL